MSIAASKSQLQSVFKRATSEFLEEQEFVTKEDIADLEAKVENSYTMEEIEEALPEDLWEVVKVHLSDPQDRESSGEDVPEIEPDEAMKSLPSNLRPDGEVPSGDIAPKQVFGDTTLDDDLEVKSEFNITGTTDALDLLYESVGDE